MYTYIHIYIYIEREREGESLKDMGWTELFEGVGLTQVARLEICYPIQC